MGDSMAAFTPGDQENLLTQGLRFLNLLVSSISAAIMQSASEDQISTATDIARFIPKVRRKGNVIGRLSNA